MFCSISGSVPEEPVVDKATGHLYEKRLVVKYIQETGKSPVSGESLSADDLVPVKSNQAVKPRPSPATSIPGLLGLFHNEWDALMLETHSLRQSLGTVRQELSQALYQHDASVRVIARLIRERDEARAALEAARAGGAAGEAANGKRAVPAEAAAGGEGAPAKKAKGGITPDVVEAMTKHSAALSKGRKKRALSASLATPEEVAGLALAGSYPLHKTTQGGILAVDFEAGKEGLVFSAGVDHSGQVFDRQAGRVVASLAGHGKKVTDVKLLAGSAAVLTTSADKTARLWRAAGEGGSYSCAAVLKDHAAEVTAASLHATGDYFATASLDRTWAFYDVATATCLQQVSEATVEGGYTAAQFHPDGLILGTGTKDALVRVWEVRQQKNVAKLSHTAGPVTSLAFSENGYYLASAGGDGVKLWDLRKLLNFRDLGGPGPVASVAFDHSGLFLAAAGAEVAVHGVKQDWGVVKTFADLPKKGAHCVKWGADARSLFVGASDHNLRVYDLSAGAAAPME